ncbi:MAG: GGDEF domain-containing protein [Labilithrix sp.]|nr:GGDEF domain-containing protein [Labilithrix sp.]MCW5831079.1 GGDEF domain-containing protein [Labilithrix sp.]
MKDPFKTRKMQTIPLPPSEAAPSAPTSSSGRASAIPLGPPSSDSTWRTGDAATERTTDPVMAVPGLAPGGKDRATLTVLAGINAGQVYALDGTEHVIGRGTEADIWVEDGGVSRRHARITCRSDGRYFVEDLGSTNGTFVGTQRVDVLEIRPGDRVQVGPHVTLRFQITDDAEEELQRRLYESSTRDALTRVYNRKYFTERLMAEVAYSRRHRVKLAVLILDLDDFKATNDTYGHLAGDMVLRLVSNQMQRLIRVEDLLARYGGEEFVILARTTGKTEAVRLAERIRSSIAELEIPVAPDRTIRGSVSVGVAALPDVAPDGGPNELLALADARLYRAKAEGKNRVCAEGEQ